MKTIVIGDIHGRDCWKNILATEEPFDKAIFLGDYVSTHDDISEEQQINNLLEILKLKESVPHKVILLIGNHDIQHLGYEWASCSGFFPEVSKFMVQQKKRFLYDAAWIHVQDGIVFSHAGISDDWMTNSGFMNLKEVQHCLPDERFGFIPDNPWDNYGNSTTQPCTWIRPEALCKCNIPEYDQVVGHTPVYHITDTYKSSKRNKHIWLCDALPREYLIIQDDSFIIKNI